MDLGLDGKRALVTGSTAGIGFAAARALAREGAQAGSRTPAGWMPSRQSTGARDPVSLA